MQFHNLAPSSPSRPKKRIGRGGKRGTFSGRGTKGQKARAGRRIRPALRDILKKIPKLRGYNQKKIPSNLLTVNTGLLEKNFEPGALVTPKTLRGKRLVKMVAGKMPRVKILGRGALSKPLEFRNVIFSRRAREAVERSGGTVRGK